MFNPNPYLPKQFENKHGNPVFKDRKRGPPIPTAQVKPTVKNKYPCPNCKYDFIVQTQTFSAPISPGPQSFIESTGRGAFHRQAPVQQQKKIIGRIPLILECGHSVCERCVRREVEISGLVNCGQCATISECPRPGDKDLYTRFPVNYYLVGILAFEGSNIMYNNQLGNQKNITLLSPSSFTSFVSAKNAESFQEKPICQECCVIIAEFHCVDCKLNLCKGCYRTIHTPKCLSHHKIIPVVQAMVKSTLASIPLCTIHTTKEQPLEFYCTNCNQDVCHSCVITNHLGHKITDLAQLNKDNLEELRQKEPQARELKQQLENTLKKVERKLNHTHISKSVSTVEKQIEQHFLETHCRLQMLESRIRKELHIQQNKCVLSLQKIQETLQSHIKTLSDILTAISMSQNPQYLANMNVHRLISELNRLEEDKKEHLVEDIGNEDIHFIVDENFLATIENHCSLECNMERNYHLVSSSDLPDGYVSPTLSASTSCSDLSYKTLDDFRASTTSLNIIKDPSAPIFLRNQFNKNKMGPINIPKKPLVEGACVPVRLTHMKSPSLFYVQHLSDANNDSKFTHSYNQMVKKTGKPTEIEINEFYFVLFNVDGNWYRGQAKQIIENGENEEKTYKINMIDYGNNIIVKIDKLRIMPPEVKIVEPRAHRCSLYDLVPIDEPWSEEVKIFILRLIENGTVTMYIMSKEENILYVDLIVNPRDHWDTSVSLRDALIFLEYGTFVKSVTYPTKVKVVEGKRKDYHSHEFAQGDMVDVQCSHIINPHNFYIQLTTFTSNLSHLMEQMQEKYAKMSKKGMIYTPHNGMPCAVLFELQWYRATVVGLPGHKQVDVFLVDYGKEERVNWDSLRVLHDEFRMMNVQAIKCSLADVEPTTKIAWSEDCIEYFRELTKQAKKLRMQVVQCASTPLKVVLYDIYREININAKFVADGFARSSGIKYVEYRELKEPVKILNKEERKPKKEFVTATYSYKKTEEKPKVIMTPANPTVLEKPGEPVRVQVNILSVVSPGCIYIRLEERRKEMADLQFALKNFYKNSLYDEDIKWKVNDKCAVCVKETWYRAMIEKPEDEEGRIGVFLKDHARHETVDKTQLRPLEASFMCLRDGSIKCCMYGIKAAGDKGEWPMIACETLREILAEYSDVYITKRGSVTEDRALPVDVWVLKTTPGSALEPSVSEWIKVNKVLVDRGLVIPVRSDENMEEAEQIESKKNDTEEKMVKNIDAITDWLELAELEETSLSFSVFDQWIPAEPPRKNKFKAIITHVDPELNIYLYDLLNISTLMKLSQDLNTHFKNVKASCEDMFWRTNQLCVIKEPETGNYYRGIVKEVNINSVKVTFVDYGYDKMLRASDLRKKIICYDVPIQAIRCRLYNLEPSNKIFWEEEALKFVNKTILNKEVYVEVKDVVDGVVYVTMKYDNYDLIETLVFRKWAIKTNAEHQGDSDSSVIIEDDSASAIESVSSHREKEDTVGGYKLIHLPNEIKTLEVEVVSAGPDQLSWYVRLAGPLAEKLADRSIYEIIFEEMQAEAGLQSVITDPIVGQACCALYKEDNKWYRGEIMDPIHINSDTLFVIFADFGNIETVPRKNVRQMKPKWLAAPMQCLLMKIPGLKVNMELENREELLDEYVESLFEDVCVAKVICIDPLTADLFDKNGNLKYKPFMDQKLFIPLK